MAAHVHLIRERHQRKKREPEMRLGPHSTTLNCCRWLSLELDYRSSGVVTVTFRRTARPHIESQLAATRAARAAGEVGP